MKKNASADKGKCLFGNGQRTDPGASSAGVPTDLETTRDALNAAMESYRQIDLGSDFKHSNSNSWSLSPDTMRMIFAMIQAFRPGHVLELGSGDSTRLIINAARQLSSSCHISSVDHDPEFIAEAPGEIHASFCSRVSVQLAPLVSRRLGERFLPTYLIDPERLASSQPIDLCVIDGPPESLGGREGTLYQLMPFLRSGSCILLDDADRPSEQKAVENWKAMLGDAIQVFEFDNFQKGLVAIVICQVVAPNQLWSHMVGCSARELARVISADSKLLLLDEYQWLGEFDDRVEFSIVREPSFPPSSGADAIEVLHKHVSDGVEYIAFPGHVYWMIDYYPELFVFLEKRSRRIVDNRRVQAYEAVGGLSAGRENISGCRLCL